jgi:8-oxo-dGTP diphosphatase
VVGDAPEQGGRVGAPVSRELLAAGGVVWRPATEGASDGVEVALVHRPRYDDWSLPKGKVDPGEHLAQTARREVLEETTIDAPLRRFLGATDYRVAAGRKRVRWWSIRAPEGAGRSFVPGDEVDELIWLPVPQALRTLSYAHDAAPVHALAHGAGRRLPPASDTTTVLLVRHAKAGRRSRWRGDDRERPLEAQGRAQAERIAAVLPVWGPERVLSADLVRCTQPVDPLAAALGVDFEAAAWASDAASAKSPKATVRALRNLAEQGTPVAICSQGETIPMVVEALAGADRVTLAALRERTDVPCRKGSTWVLSFAGRRLVAADYLADLAPALPA